jgi:hypothetical protein
LLAAVVIGACFLAPRSRLTQTNFDRVQQGMTREEVQAILGDGELYYLTTGQVCKWDSGSIFVVGVFRGNRLRGKRIQVRTVSEILSWYAERGTEKLGLN